MVAGRSAVPGPGRPVCAVAGSSRTIVFLEDGELVDTLDWTNLPASRLRELAAADAVVLVPVGSMEQHGPHLPVQVDALLATAVSQGAAARLSATTQVVVAPTVWCGLAEHHMAFGGTISLDFDTFRALLRCICASIARHGFRRIAVVNGHGGNVTALNVITGELARELDVPLTTLTYWLLAGAAERFSRILERQSSVRHACEAETSMLLEIAPELVDQGAMGSADGTAEGVLEASGAYRYRSFADLSANGVLGYPSAASAAKGRQLLDAASEALADALSDAALWK